MALFALFTLGYLIGVWTACAVLRQPQRAYEQGVISAQPGLPLIVLESALRAEVTRL
jgi:hypothetical protein